MLDVGILFIDDDPLVLEALKRALRQMPWRSTFLTDPEQALAVVDADEIAVVVTDNSMPGLTGLQVLEQLRQKKPLVRRVLLTGDVERPHVVAAVADGLVECCLPKPWAASELREQLYRLAEEASSKQPPAPGPADDDDVLN